MGQSTRLSLTTDQHRAELSRGRSTVPVQVRNHSWLGKLHTFLNRRESIKKKLEFLRRVAMKVLN